MGTAGVSDEVSMERETAAGAAADDGADCGETVCGETVCGLETGGVRFVGVEYGGWFCAAVPDVGYSSRVWERDGVVSPFGCVCAGTLGDTAVWDAELFCEV